MILVMSGTKDGRELIQALSSIKCDIIATTTTTYGGSLIESSDHVSVIDHPLNLEHLVKTIRENEVSVLIDATHPYATGASENAMAAAEETACHYVRYERESLTVEEGKWFSNYAEIIDYLKEREGNILLTIGANNLELFTIELPKERLFARVLPMSKIIAKCESYGLNPKNILGLQGPFSREYNEVMMDSYDIKFLVSKATAKTGGFDQKVLAAKNKGVELLVLERPAIAYTRVYTSIDKIVDHVENFVNHIDRA